MAKKYKVKTMSSNNEALTPKRAEEPLLTVKSSHSSARYIQEMLNQKFDLNLGNSVQDLQIFGNEPYAIAVIKKFACRSGNAQDRITANELLLKLKQSQTT